MNRYGALAEDYWKRVAPLRYQGLENPESFFTDLGNQAMTQIGAILDQTERTVSQDLPYLERVGALNAKRRQAEEIVLADLVYWVPVELSMTEELATILAGLPADTELMDSLRRVTDQAEEEGWDEDLEADRDQLVALMPLMTHPNGQDWRNLEGLTEDEIQEWILKLLPFWDPEEQTIKRLP